MRPPFVALVATALCLLAGPAFAGLEAVPSRCRAQLAERLPDAQALCLRQAGVQVGASPPRTAVAALFEREEAQLAAGRFDLARDALACAESLVGRDIDLRYELVRRHGIVAFREERIPQALDHFECAVKWAVARGDRKGQARDLKNVGAALRRLGDYRGALSALTASLQMQRRDGDVAGAVYNNLADVYRELDDADASMRYYGDALEAFRAKGDPIEAAHVLESMAEQALDSGDPARAAGWLREALVAYRQAGNRVYELRVHDGLTRAALAQGDLAQARDWAASAQAIASSGQLPIPPALQLQIARTERLSGRAEAAIGRIRRAMDGLAADDPDRIRLLEALADAQSDAGQTLAANDTLRTLFKASERAADARHDRQLDWLRIRFDTSERDRIIADLEHRNRVRTLQFWGASVSGLALVLCVWLLLERRRQRQKLEAEARRVRLEEELARYRREADALAEDRALLQTLLDSREDAACLLDADGMVLAANEAAGRLIGVAPGALVGSAFADALAPRERDGFDALLERMEDSAAQSLPLETRGGAHLNASMTQWSGGGGRLVLGLAPCAADDAQPVVGLAAVAAAAVREDADEAQDDTVPEPGSDVARDGFRRALVELMLATIEAWESATASNRIELAEKSRIWRVNIDDGRLRARAMERYLNVGKLPRNPRWRDVLRTAYFVLGQCPGLGEPGRERLQRHVDAVLAYTRRDTMV